MEGKIWAVAPAAGVGRRMNASVPKQYLYLGGETVLERTLKRLLSVVQIERIVVPVASHDNRWSGFDIFQHPNIETCIGGEERVHSVLSGLRYLRKIAGPEDWVLVHDIARPCVRRTDIEKLIQSSLCSGVGGILAARVSDTLKRARTDMDCTDTDDSTDSADTDSTAEISATIDRTQIWRAFTPQMFPLVELQHALERALADGELVTDEASAMELLGQAPKLVPGAVDNIKITESADLQFAEMILELQEQAECQETQK
nr:2-C-methyl-D-erythritol 4-phosphate cytidylyltransferase [Oleiphilus messinensis]